MKNSVEALELSPVEVKGAKGQPLLEDNLSIIKDVKVKLEIRVGEAELSVDELMNLQKDSVVKLSCSTTAPVDLLLDSKVVARGHLVAAGDNFGLQISELSK